MHSKQDTISIVENFTDGYVCYNMLKDTKSYTYFNGSFVASGRETIEKYLNINTKLIRSDLSCLMADTIKQKFSATYGLSIMIDDQSYNLDSNPLVYISLSAPLKTYTDKYSLKKTEDNSYIYQLCMNLLWKTIR